MTAPAVSPAAPVRWWLPLIEGMLALLVGIWLFTQPVATSVGCVLGLGMYWVAVGVIDLVRLMRNGPLWGWKLFSGVLGILAGGAILSGLLGQNHPLGTAVVVGSSLTVVIGIVGIAYGSCAVVDAVSGGGWWSGVLGAMGLLFGFVVLAHPLAATLTLPWSLGTPADRRR